MGIYEECPHCGANKVMEDELRTQFSCGSEAEFLLSGSIRIRKSEECKTSVHTAPSLLGLGLQKKTYNVVKYD